MIRDMDIDGCVMGEDAPLECHLADALEAAARDGRDVFPHTNGRPRDNGRVHSDGDATRSDGRGAESADATPLPARRAEAETNLLGSLLSAPPRDLARVQRRCKLILRLTNELAAYSWSVPAHRDIFGALSRITDGGAFPSAVVVQSELARLGAGEASALTARLALESPNDDQAEYWFRQSVELGAACSAYSAAERLLQALDSGQTAEEARAGFEAAAPPAKAELPKLTSVSIADCVSSPEPPQANVIEKILPAGLPGLLGGHGGAFKSTLAIMFAVCVGTGTPIFGLQTVLTPVLYYSAEDGTSLLRRRVAAICIALGVNPQAVEERVTFVDGTVLDDPCLYAVTDQNGPGQVTRAYAALAAMAENLRPGLLIVDNASDIYGGNENSRRHVTGCVRALDRIVRPWGGTLLLLVHINRAAATGNERDGNSYAGSTSWHNAPRNRLALVAKTGNPDDGLELRHEKCTPARRADPIPLRFEGGALWEDQKTVGVAGASNELAILRLMAEFQVRGEVISTSGYSPNNPYRKLSGEPTFPRKISRPDLETLIRNLQRKGLIEIGLSGPKSRATESWRISAAGSNIINGGSNRGGVHWPMKSAGNVFGRLRGRQTNYTAPSLA